MGLRLRLRLRLHAFLCLYLSSLAASGAVLATAPECDAPAHATTLVTEVGSPVDARAAWLDDQSLLWPGQETDGRYVLVYAAAPTLVAEPGEAVRGADGRITLTARGRSADPRAAWLGPGVVLAVAAADRVRLPAMLRGSWLLVKEDGQGRVMDATRTQHALLLDALYAQAAELWPLGATRHPGGSTPPGTRFAVWAPTATQVSLCLYPDARAPAQRSLPMQRDAASGVWQLLLPEDLDGHAYTYLVDVWAPGHGQVRNRVTDPYALSLTTDSERAVVVDLSSPALAPPGWADTQRPNRVTAATDLVVYELHVRDFSAQDASVPAAHRGKYLAFTHTASQGMHHLRRLAEAGVTDVHLLPVFDIATVPEAGCVTPSPAGAPDGETQQAAVLAVKDRDCFNWGYDPLHFTAPEGSYATDSANGAARIIEFRRMVQALHQAGLRVGMDVVYNHTSAAGQDPKSVLDRLVPGYYHRLDERGAITRSTCCDNTATEHHMMARLMIDSAVVWARDHRIDSFRFDLMGHQPRAAMARLQQAVDAAAGRRVHLIGEGWNFGEVADGRRFVQASQRSLAGTGIATFSDRMRDAVRGGGASDNGTDQIVRQGFMSGLHLDPNELAAGLTTNDDLLAAADLVRAGLAGTLGSYTLTDRHGRQVSLAQLDYAGQPAGYAAEPGEVVNYVENHDNPTLFDANAFKLPLATPREDRARAQVLASAAVLFSQGIAYLHAGQEILRSKSMDRNSYDSGDWFNRIDWTLQDNHFGTGLPPRPDNESSWPLMRPRLANPALRPTPADIRWTRDAVLDLLRIRDSSTLLRLRTAADVNARLTMHNTGPDQVPGVLVGQVDGRGYPGAGFATLVYVINAAPVARTVVVEPLRGQALDQHPVHRAADAADRRAAQATYDPQAGRFDLPARTAVVFVR